MRSGRSCHPDLERGHNPRLILLERRHKPHVIPSAARDLLFGEEEARIQKPESRSRNKSLTAVGLWIQPSRSCAESRVIPTSSESHNPRLIPLERGHKPHVIPSAARDLLFGEEEFRSQNKSLTAVGLWGLLEIDETLFSVRTENHTGANAGQISRRDRR